jgi:uncharacterized membrane protein
VVIPHLYLLCGQKRMKLKLDKFLHESFQTGIFLKGFDGASEILGGVLVWLLNPVAAERTVYALFGHQLAANPHAFLATHLIGALQSLAHCKAFAAGFLLSGGLTKVVVVVALWFERLWAYPLMIVMLGAFAVYQIDWFSHTHSLILVVLTLFDLLAVWLTWHEYRERNRIRSLRAD